MRYILFTYDSIESIMGERHLQSVDYEEGREFYRFIVGDIDEWKHESIKTYRDEEGLIFYTKKITRDKGLLFDLTTFKGFVEEKADLKRVSLIILKTLRYAVKYYEKLYLSQNERYLPDNNITLVFPYPFRRDIAVPKVVVDCNNWKEAKRKNYNYLTAYDYQTHERSAIDYRSLAKAVKTVQNIKSELAQNRVLSNETETQVGYKVTGLTSPDIRLTPGIGAENWNVYLTNSQSEFVHGDLNGPERLEGAAGTGKTLAMCLRIINLLRSAKSKGESLNLIYFTHSVSTRDAIIDWIIDNCDGNENFLEFDQGRPMQSVKVSTLQEWCALHLGINDLGDEEYLDKDAGDSKIKQLSYIENAWCQTREALWQIMQNELSDTFKNFISDSTDEIIVEILQREFSEIIKGQAKLRLDHYLKLERPLYGIALENEYDKRYIFEVFKIYQNSLSKLGLFDTDDIVISSLGQIDAPIWNRRRIKEGYDGCFIDETHLFNLNEISVFHFVNKPEKRNNIVFCIDQSQRVGDSYRTDAVLIKNENDDSVSLKTARFNTLFRSAPDVAALAFSILTSGAAMFKTLVNPMIDYTAISDDLNAKGRMPVIKLTDSLKDTIEKSFAWAEEYCTSSKSKRNTVLMVATDDEVLNNMVRFAENVHKPYVVLNGRMDQANIKKAINDNRFVLGGIDYIGGLEFNAVVIVGIDGKRVPPANTLGGQHIINFAWYNRLYVAVTRAKYAVAMFGDVKEGDSPLLYGAIEDGTLLKE